MRQEKHTYLGLLFLVTVLSFLAGFGFEKFLKTRLNVIQLSKRNIRNSGVINNSKNKNNINRPSTHNNRPSAQHHPNNDNNANKVYNSQKPFSKRNFESRDQTWGDVENEYRLFHDEAVKEVRAKILDEKYKYLTEEPHIAGSERNNRLASFIAEEWRSASDYTKVYEKKYDVLLSVPTKPAVVNLYDNLGNLEYECTTTEKPFYKEENSSSTVYPFNAYSKSGDVKARYVNVHYGNTGDYIDLKKSNIDLKGKIFVARYGKAFRGEKARLAVENGALGLLLYPDPEDFGKPGAPVYPDSWDLPPIGILRGTLNRVKGDPLTFRLPATDGMFRFNEEKIDHLPEIPVQPISYLDAEQLLQAMDGMKAPPRWSGGLNITYHINTTKSIHLKVSTPRVKRTITNVMGVIRGDIEPDRFIVIGNHRDSWIFGGGDPSSGTTCFLELSRVLGILLKRDWRPRRTIIMMSWDAEEYGLVGSTEWLQEYFTLMQGKAIAYLNIDIGVSGSFNFRAKATPSLIDTLFEVTKLVESPQDKPTNTTTVFALWKERNPNLVNPKEPSYAVIKSGSDFQGFYALFGIACTDIRWVYNQFEHDLMSNYPVYHTIYDNYQYFKKFIDPDMRYHVTVTKIWIRHLLKLSDDILVPFNLTRYAEKIKLDFELFNVSYFSVLDEQNIGLDHLFIEINNLVAATKDFHGRLNGIYKQDIFGVRRVNDQMMWFERAFIIPEGLPGRSSMKHAIFSPARKTTFSRSTFPGLTETLYEIEIEKKKDRWDTFNEQLSLLLNCLRNAIQVISKDDIF